MVQGHRSADELNVRFSAYFLRSEQGNTPDRSISSLNCNLVCKSMKQKLRDMLVVRKDSVMQAKSSILCGGSAFKGHLCSCSRVVPPKF